MKGKAKTTQIRHKGKDKPKDALPEVDVSHPALKDLKLKHAQAVMLYANGMSQKAACEAVGYSADYGGQLFNKPYIRAAILELKKTVAERLGITVESVLSEIACIAFNDPRKLFNDDGSLKDVGEWDEKTARAVAGLDVSTLTMGKDADTAITESVKKVKLSPKTQALEMLARHLQLFIDKKEISGPGGGPVQVQAIPLTEFPPEPASLAEWEAQQREASAKRAKEAKEAATATTALLPACTGGNEEKKT